MFMVNNISTSSFNKPTAAGRDGRREHSRGCDRSTGLPSCQETLDSHYQGTYSLWRDYGRYQLCQPCVCLPNRSRACDIGRCQQQELSADNTTRHLLFAPSDNALSVVMHTTRPEGCRHSGEQRERESQVCLGGVRSTFFALSLRTLAMENSTLRPTSRYTRTRNPTHPSEPSNHDH